MVALLKMVFPVIRKYLRLFLSMMLTSALGIALMVGLWGVYSNLEYDLDLYEDTYGYPDVSISCLATRADLTEIKEIDGVKAIETRYSFDVSIPLENAVLTARVFTFDDENDFETFYVRDEKLSDTLPNLRMEYRYAKDNDIHCGDTVTLYYYNLEYVFNVGQIISRPDTISCKQNRFVSGESPNFSYVFVDKKDIPQSEAGYYNRIYLESDGTRSNDEILEDVLDKLPSRVIVSESYTEENSLLARTRELNFTPLHSLMVAVPPIFFSVTMLIVFLFMVQILNQERKNIGIYKALGFKNKEIIPLYLLVGLLIAIFACILGVPIGYGITSFAMYIYQNSFTLPHYVVLPVLSHILLACGINILVVIAASLFSTLKVVKVEPKEAMSAQGSALRNPGFIRKLKVPMSVKITISSILRNWKRFIFSAVCTASSIMLILAAIYFYASGGYVKSQSFNQRFRYDAMVYYASKVSDVTTAKYEQSDNITAYETIDISTISFTYQDKNVSVTLFGLSENSMMGVPDLDGRGLQDVPKSGIILDKKTSEKYGIEVGSYIYVGSSKIRVEGISRQFISSVCYMNKESMEKLDITYYGGIICKCKDTEELLSFASKTPYYASTELTVNLRKFTDSCFNMIYIGVYILIGFSIITGFIIIYNITQINLKECEHEIAVMKTLGVRQSYISLSWLSESLVQFLLAFIIGIPIGNVMAKIILGAMQSNSWEYPYYHDAVLALLTAAFALVFVLLSHVLSMMRVRKWNLAELTRSKE